MHLIYVLLSEPFLLQGTLKINSDYKTLMLSKSIFPVQITEVKLHDYVIDP